MLMNRRIPVFGSTLNSTLPSSAPVIDDVTPARLQAAVQRLLSDPGQRAAMAEQARRYGRPDATERLVGVVLEAARR
ncbi:hypothetical protein ACQB60_40990 [Actinomycetota bacterium Odt1-20B]